MVHINRRTGLLDPGWQERFTDPPLGENMAKHDRYVRQIKMQRQVRKKRWKEPSIKLPPKPISPNKSLLITPSSSQNNITGCCNAANRTHMWSGGLQIALAVTDGTWPMLNNIMGICQGACIYECNNQLCTRTRNYLRKILPACEWDSFREWIIQIVSCQKILAPPDTPVEDIPDAFFYLGGIIGGLFWLFENNKRGREITINSNYVKAKKTGTMDMFSVCEMIHWGVTAEAFMGMDPVWIEPWGKSMIPHSIVARPVAQAFKEAAAYPICLNRLWNLTFISERGEHDIPVLMDLVRRRTQLRQVGHESCTAELCALTTVNFTRVRQLHKCGQGAPVEANPAEDSEVRANCEAESLYFDPDLLKKSIESGSRTVWSIKEPFEVSEKPYVAISHVWSDGTGIGLRPVGEINKCLFRYFSEMVKQLGCDAIWWDTISIPTDPELRRREINEMHNNYSRAKYTLVHDEYLTQFEWINDGSPALALVLSPWFTRGWTALECIMSKCIKVVFKKAGGGPGEYVIKDLDDDILSRDPGISHPAHWIASRMIRRLRKPIDNVGDLLAILKPRSTSWARDKMIIAGLLAGVQVYYTMSPTDLTKSIIRKLKEIKITNLFHGSTTICESGGWSWCPNNLYDMPSTPPTEFSSGDPIIDASCFVDEGGTLGGKFQYRAVTVEDIAEGRIIPISSHPSVAFKIKSALELEWKSCVLLGFTPESYILAAAEGFAKLDSGIHHGRHGEFVPCRYIGTVRVFEQFDFITEMRTSKNFMIGRDKARYGLTETGADIAGPREDHAMDFLWQYFWMGDGPQGSLLIPRRIETDVKDAWGKRWTTTMHELLVREGPDNKEPIVLLNSEPSLRISDRGAVTDVGANWSKFPETPYLARVKLASFWPPTSIPMTRRSTSHLVKLRHGPATSREHFRLLFKEKYITFAAIGKELLAPSNECIFRGIWACSIDLTCDRYEILLFQQPTRDELVATKITTADSDQPPGYKTFIIKDLYSKNVRAWRHARPPTSIILDGEFGSGGPIGDNDPRTLTSRKFEFVNKDTINLLPLEGEDKVWKYRRIPSLYNKELGFMV
ncbi:hypothetical protein TWF694_006333 [Orbilia ellipsospora]|uniref:Heterokaryon incompatibility domain-containing protein n=1 Tax=Orbilia ellipsospora TaxID=2528407 RepID=A0AAV9XLF9_9PEZI